MSLVSQIIARLKAGVPDLGNRVEGAAAAAALFRAGGVPQVALVAHVLGTAIVGKTATPMTGLYRQAVERLVTVMLTVNTGHAQGGRLAEQLEDLVDAIIAALVGWQPTGAVGVVVFRRSQLIDATGGVFRHEITFGIEHELRIPS